MFSHRVRSDPNFDDSPHYLPRLFGDTVQVHILETLLQLLFKEENTYSDENPNPKPLWLNISEIARASNSSKSSAKRILDHLLAQEFIEERIIETHAQTPPRYFRINSQHPAIRDLIFFYSKVRGSL